MYVVFMRLFTAGWSSQKSPNLCSLKEKSKGLIKFNNRIKKNEENTGICSIKLNLGKCTHIFIARKKFYL